MLRFTVLLALLHILPVNCLKPEDEGFKLGEDGVYRKVVMVGGSDGSEGSDGRSCTLNMKLYDGVAQLSCLDEKGYIIYGSMALGGEFFDRFYPYEDWEGKNFAASDPSLYDQKPNTILDSTDMWQEKPQNTPGEMKESKQHISQHMWHQHKPNLIQEQTDTFETNPHMHGLMEENSNCDGNYYEAKETMSNMKGDCEETYTVMGKAETPTQLIYDEFHPNKCRPTIFRKGLKCSGGALFIGEMDYLFVYGHKDFENQLIVKMDGLCALKTYKDEIVESQEISSDLCKQLTCLVGTTANVKNNDRKLRKFVKQMIDSSTLNKKTITSKKKPKDLSPQKPKKKSWWERTLRFK